MNVGSAEDFERLTSYMSDTAFAKADEKLKLVKVFESLAKESIQEEFSIDL